LAAVSDDDLIPVIPTYLKGPPERAEGPLSNEQP
jgi:hypothetical protein